MTSFDFIQTSKNQIWRLISGPLMLFFIPLYLSPEAQGYWFTFISLAALVVFADMGFTTILLQFSAHEYLNLEFSQSKVLVGRVDSLQRIATLFVFSIKWAFSMALLASPLILILGFLVLDNQQTNIDWMMPWIIYTIASILVFLNGVVLSFIEGCDSVGRIQGIRFKIQFVTSITMIILLFFGAGLYALALSLLIGAMAGAASILVSYKNMLMQLFSLGTRLTHQWSAEIIPLLGRYAVSFLSGYAIFSLFTIVAFKFFGAIEAGKVGLSIAICTAIFGIANIWITVIIPKINMHVEAKNYFELNAVFKRHLLASCITYCMGMIALFLIKVNFGELLPISNRIVDTFSLSMLATGWFLQIIVNALAVYLRAHKREPLMLVSVVSAAYTIIVTSLICMFLSFNYFFMGFLSSYFIFGPWIIRIFLQEQEFNIGIAHNKSAR